MTTDGKDDDDDDDKSNGREERSDVDSGIVRPTDARRCTTVQHLHATRKTPSLEVAPTILATFPPETLNVNL